MSSRGTGRTHCGLGVAVTAALALLAAGAGQASDRFFAGANDSWGSLYAYDPGTNAATPITANTDAATGFLDVSPAGELYGLRNINYGTKRTELVRLDKTTGAPLSSVILTHNGTNVVPCGGLTFAPDGTLYIHDGVASSSATPRLFTADVATGALALIGQITNLDAGERTGGMEYAGGSLYLVRSSRLWRVNPATGEAARISPFGYLNAVIADLDCDSSGVMRGTATAARALHQIDLSTGQSSFVCTIPYSYPAGLATMPTAAAPTVTAIDPDRAVTGTSVTCSITGTDLSDGCTVRLERAGQTAVSGGAVTFVASTSVTATFDLSGAQTGLWDVVVTNPDDRAGTLPAGFAVQAPGSLEADDATAQTGSTATLTARLSTGGQGVSGREIRFEVGGAPVGTGTTDTDGIAACDYTVTQPAGTYPIAASFAGDESCGPAEATAALKVTTPATLALADAVVRPTKTARLKATLTDGDGGVAGRTILFQVGGTPVGTGVTDHSGLAICRYPVTETPGTYPLTASFAGDAQYAAAEDTATLTVITEVCRSIALTLSSYDVVSGGSVEATVIDNCGVDLSDDCVLYIQYGAGGSWSGTRYTSARAGTWTVTATYGPCGDTAQLTVGTNTTAAPACVTLSPAEAAIGSGEQQTYVVTATDAAGNAWAPDAAEITWAGGAGAFTDYTYTPASADEGSTLSITATVNGICSPAASLTVYPEGGPGTILAWDVTQQAFYLCANPLNPETGQLIAGTNGTHTYSINGPDDVTVVVSGTSTNRTVSVAGLDVSNSLQVRWYVRSGAVYQATVYSTIAGVRRTSTYSSGRTCVDGVYGTGFWGLTHQITGSAVTCGCSPQP